MVGNENLSRKQHKDCGQAPAVPVPVRTRDLGTDYGPGSDLPEMRERNGEYRW